jgi:1,4-dihydroxy-2-naphthoate polyprenyltransferase
MNNIYRWVMAMRLETVTLSMSSVGLGSALAAFTGHFNVYVGILAALTASLLQVICNLANDYGDFVRGADSINKVKPPGAIQMRLVTLAQVGGVLPWLVGAAMGFGTFLLHTAKLAHTSMVVFTFLGIFAVVAAITYTMGNKPYGYQGWGDVAVFIFFGLVGVGGTFYLHTQQSSSIWLLPAISCGSLAVGVLNVNNIRDLSADAQVGKNTIPVRFGRKTALCYHWYLITGSVVAVLVFLLCYVHTPWPYACLCAVPLLLRHGMMVGRQGPSQLTEQLQGLVCIMLVFIVLLSVGLVL